LPFPVRNAKVKDLIDLVGEEVKAMSGTVWQLNDNFIVLAIEGVLNMLNGASCQELSWLHELAASSDVSVIENVPADVRKLAVHLVRKWWINMDFRRPLLEVGNAETVSSTIV
jgi:hypothetical protein